MRMTEPELAIADIDEYSVHVTASQPSATGTVVSGAITVAMMRRIRS
jgi:hypothetical protein